MNMNNKQYLIALLALCTLATFVHCADYNANDFKSGLFKFNSLASGVYEIDIGDITGQFMMAYADFNGDKNTDMITVTAPVDGVNTVQSIYVNLWSPSSGQFAQWKLESLNLACSGSIVNIIPGDINYDGKLDFVVVTRTAASNFCLDFVKQISCSLSGVEFALFDFSASIGSYSLNRQPIAGDFTGNHYFQLMIYNIAATPKPVRVVFEFTSDVDVKTYEFFNLISRDDECRNYEDHVNFADPNFSAIVDFTGDCRADLVIHTDAGLEFWAKTDSRLLCLVEVQPFDRLNASLISISFTDVNFDGSVDLVALVKDTSAEQVNYDIVIMYSMFTVDASSLCSGFSKFPYESISQDGNYVQYQQLNMEIFANTKGVSPPQLRFADINWDGMPDIVITRERTPKNAGYGQVVILMNSDCSSTSSECANLKVAAKRTFTASTDSNFQGIYNVEATNIAFFDINEDGKIDFLINSFENGRKSIRCFYNYISTDAFFLKALNLNGQCVDTACQSSVYYGATIQCKVTTLDTDYKVGTGVQLPQSASCPLQLPFIIIGLARTNNYIENFTVGLPQSDSDDSKRVWTPIIPNSQLIIYPQSEKTINWGISIFVQPNDALIIVIFVTLIILVLLGAIIIYYHRQENVANRKGREEFLKMVR